MRFLRHVPEAVLTLGVLASLAALPLPAPAADIAAQKSTLVTIPATFVVNAAPAKVWAAVAGLEGFCALTGFVADAGAKPAVFAKVGDAAPATVWTDQGTLVATHVVKEKELRVAWEPANGGYLCQKRVVLSAQGSGTKVEYWDRYTDDQANVDETAATVVKETAAGIAKFTALAAK